MSSRGHICFDEIDVKKGESQVSGDEVVNKRRCGSVKNVPLPLPRSPRAGPWEERSWMDGLSLPATNWAEVNVFVFTPNLSQVYFFKKPPA